MGATDGTRAARSSSNDGKTGATVAKQSLQTNVGLERWVVWSFSTDCISHADATVPNKKEANRGPRHTPEGLRPQHPQRGGTGVDNNEQRETNTSGNW